VSSLKKTDECIALETQSRAPLLAFILTLDGGSSDQNRAGLEAKRSTAELPTLAAGFAFCIFVLMTKGSRFC
jgi:hypothetical protein